jgi:hypothetical protein
VASIFGQVVELVCLDWNARDLAIAISNLVLARSLEYPPPSDTLAFNLKLYLILIPHAQVLGRSFASQVYQEVILLLKNAFRALKSQIREFMDHLANVAIMVDEQKG